jgi:hypothetical protein
MSTPSATDPQAVIDALIDQTVKSAYRTIYAAGVDAGMAQDQITAQQAIAQLQAALADAQSGTAQKDATIADLTTQVARLQAQLAQQHPPSLGNRWSLSPGGLVTRYPGTKDPQAAQQLTRVLSILAGAGCCGIRLPFAQGWVMPTAPTGPFTVDSYQWAWKPVDRFVAAAHQLLLPSNVDGIIGHLTDSAPWMVKPTDTKIIPRAGAELDVYAGFLSALIDHLDSIGMVVHRWESWNEQNNGYFAHNANAVGDWVTFARRVYAVVHGKPGHEHDTVIAGGLAPRQTSSKDSSGFASWSMVDWLTAAYRAGMRHGETHDAVAVHPYPGDKAPAGLFAAGGMLAQVLSVLDLNGDPSLVWATEAGIHANTGANQGPLLAQLVQAWAGFVNSGRGAGPLFVHTAQPMPASITGANASDYGVLDDAGNARQALASLSSLQPR